MNSAAAGVLAGLLMLPAYSQEPSARGVNFYSPVREVQLGQEEAAALARTLPIVHEPKLDAYLAKLTPELAKYASQQFTYSFTLYEDRKSLGLQRAMMPMPVDAFQGRAAEPVALAGGPILIPMSLLANAPEEAELAFQLAHAMAHIALRHSTREATRQELINIAAGPLAVKVQDYPRFARDALLTSQDIALQTALLTFIRTFEMQADSVATGIVAAAGYDPGAMVSYLEGQPPAAGAVPKVFAAHPTVNRRVATIKATLEKLPSRHYAGETGDFDEVKALAASVR